MTGIGDAGRRPQSRQLAGEGGLLRGTYPSLPWLHAFLGQWKLFMWVLEARYSVFVQHNQYHTDLTHWPDMSVQPTHSQQPLRGSAVPGFTDDLQAV